MAFGVEEQGTPVGGVHSLKPVQPLSGRIPILGPKPKETATQILFCRAVREDDMICIPFDGLISVAVPSRGIVPLCDHRLMFVP